MSEYTDILITPRLVQVIESCGEFGGDRAAAMAIAESIVGAAAESSAKLQKGEVTLTFELMPASPPPEPDLATPDL